MQGYTEVSGRILPTSEQARREQDHAGAVKRVMRLTGATQEAARAFVKSVGAAAVIEATDADIREVCAAF